MIHILFSMDEEQGYSKNDQIPWKENNEWIQFQQITQNQVVIMGHSVFSSYNMSLLSNRIPIIISSDYISTKNYYVLPSLADAISFALTFKKLIYIIGGKRLIIETLKNYRNVKFHLMIMKGSYMCDTFWNSIEWDKFNIIRENQLSNTILRELEGNFYNPADIEYLKLAQTILQYGTMKSDRTGTGTISMFGQQMKFNLQQQIPILTTKFIPWKSCISEFLWFLKGQTDVSLLEKEKVHIWTKHSSRDFLDQRQLQHLQEGDIGAGYGFQWRHFGANYIDCKDTYNDQGIDQITNLIKMLQNDPNSRRIFMSSWNPSDLNKMALPPCHVSCQFYITDNKYISCHLYQRSMDLFLGAPWNILSYSVFTYLLGKLCNYEPYELIISIGDCHIYKDHIPLIQTQFDRLPYPPSQFIVNDSVLTKSLDEIVLQDFQLINYQSHDKIIGQMSV